MAHYESAVVIGWGDEIMVTGEAVRLECTRHFPLVVLGKDGKPRWHPIWDGNPRIYKPGTPFPKKFSVIRNHGGWRPYVVYNCKEFHKQCHNQTKNLNVTNKKKWFFTPGWKTTKGEIFCVRTVITRDNYIVIEPHVKPGFINKQWGWNCWQSLVDLLEDTNILVQVGPKGTKILRGVHFIETPTFIDACKVLAKAKFAVLPEGGLHHAAAALDIPSVVLFGGAHSPKHTGYDDHVNIADSLSPISPCGMRVPCNHCADAWARILPIDIANTVMELWEKDTNNYG